MSLQHKYSFPVRQHNRFEILVDGEQYFPAMLAAIDSAQEFIFLEQYLVITGHIGKQFVNALTRAVQRRVTVYCLFDDYGSRGLTQYSRQQLINAGIHLAFYNPIKLSRWQSALFRDHRKLLLVDHSCAFVGGAGITDDFIATDNKPGWHDVMLLIQGEVLLDWYQMFRDTWRQIRRQEIITSTEPKPSSTFRQSGQSIDRVFIVRSSRERVTGIWMRDSHFLDLIECHGNELFMHVIERGDQKGGNITRQIHLLA